MHEAPLDEDGVHPVRPVARRTIAMGALALALVMAGVTTVVPRLTTRVTTHPSPANSTISIGSIQVGGVTNLGSNGLPSGWHLVTQFIANGQADPGDQIYSAQVHNTSWQSLAPQTRDFPLRGIDWDAQGRLTTLYGADGNGALAAYSL